MRVFIPFTILTLFLNTAFAQEAVKEANWDQDKGILSYNLPKDSRVKIRVGSASGPVYRTLVNLEERKAGNQQEVWDGKDELDLIDFTEFGPLHFCVDILSQVKEDLMLSVSLAQEAPLAGGILNLRAPFSPTVKIDLDEAERAKFSKEGIEIMAFLDNRLIKLEKTEALPYTFNLDLKSLSSTDTKHLLTLNVWSGDHTSVAYKNFIVMAETEKESAPKQKAANLKLSGKIAYCQRNKGFWQVWVANLDGSKPRQLTKSPVDKRYPEFSCDGKKIVYVTNHGELWMMSSSGSDNHRIPLSMHVSQPHWSADGKKLVFISYQDLYHGDSEIWEVEIETLKVNKLLSRPWLQYDPCYASDQCAIIFTDGPELYEQEIRRLDFKRGDVTQLTDNGPYDYDMQPVYSADGEMITHSSNESGNYDIWIMDKFGRGKKNLTPNPAFEIMPKLSADKEKIYFLSDRSGALEVWQIDKEGKNLLQITQDKTDKQDLAIYTH